MRCVAVKPEGALLVDERDDPVAGPGEVLVAIKAAGLNTGK